MNNPMKLWYTEPAPMGNEDFAIFEWGKDRPDDGWEKWSLPIGNGNIGVCVFGRTETERLQFAEKSLSTSYHVGGQNNFAEVYLDFHHAEVDGYERSLSLDDAVARVRYAHQGVEYVRECFASYPANVFAMRISASKPGSVSFDFRPTIPYIGERDSKLRKTGLVFATGNEVVLTGELMEFGVKFAGVFRVVPEGGTLETRDDSLAVRGADRVVVLAVLGTNYQLESRVFTEPEPRKKLAGYPDPLPRVRAVAAAAEKRGYEALLSDHLEDYRDLFGRVDLQLADAGPSSLPTDERLRAYQAGGRDPGLEALFFQYGRYLLIASSRPGTLPAHLQGAWNRYDHAPWSAGYWHNINVQMNYWPAFSTNLAETFEAYAAYHQAYLPLAQRHAYDYIQACHPERHVDGEDGWIIGTGAWPYDIQGLEVKDHELQGHSGPGTGGLTSLLFWEWYQFSHNRTLLADSIYPALAGMSRYLSKVVEEHDGKLLVTFSASPEQRHNGEYYHTTGCAFDQQMIYENHTATLAAAAELGIEDDFTALLREQVKRLDPVQVGESGQIKEFREEKAYGEIGEYAHRHVSHLVSLYPGCAINAETPEWIEAAKTTLDLRGDRSTGWGMAHRMLLWARTKDGARAYRLFRMLLEHTTYPNLWAAHPPFQIDANFGATAGVAEMLLQSHENYIEPLPALPPEWADGSFSGLCARGCFEVAASWRAHRLESVSIQSQNGGGPCRLKLSGFARPVAEPRIDFDFDPRTGVAAFTVERGATIAFRDAAAAATTAAC